MGADASVKQEAIHATEETCPRCRSARGPDERYCLDCGLELPVVTGTLASLRRRWIRTIGWYPGDWIWVPLLTLVVAVMGAATAIVLTGPASPSLGPAFSVPPTVPASTPSTTPSSPTNTSTLPTAPEPTTAPAPTPAPPARTSPPAPNGRLSWPATRDGWTVVLVSYPQGSGREPALATAARAVRARLQQVGTLDSSSYASLQPGYVVVFSGIYSSKGDADASLPTVRQAGFPGAYSRQIAR